MAEKKRPSAQKALTIRVPTQWIDVLETARYLRGHDSMQNLIEDVLREFTLQSQQEAAVQKLLQTRREYQTSRRPRLVKAKG